jgi:hypothetical protein
MRTVSMRWIAAAVCSMGLMTIAAGGQAPKDQGLLFYLSGDRGVTADVASGGDPQPNFSSGVQVIQDGAKGPGLQCAHTQLLSYWAPGNIYAERGTLSFFWRSREPVGPTPFPLFRVGYADHSSWDMVWLRIDYNGTSGFDAFVTDASLARTRVSYAMPAFPAPSQWVHLTLSWDQTRGIRFYVNGALASKVDGTAIFNAALDQFGPHQRIVSPYQVQSAYNFVRGGDIDELRIYDRMLSDENVAALARGDAPAAIPVLQRSLDAPQWRDEWWYRYGWNRPGDAPPPIEGRNVSIRKVEIHDAFDLKRWWWKGNDGIRETTWPGVYNRSRLAGRNDYFQLPDWDCYSLSGKSVTFTMPDEPWNQIEVSGAAFGTFAIDTPAFERPKGQERTFHRLAQPVRGQTLRFTNVEQETPIGELGAYYVVPGSEPAGIGRLTYRLTSGVAPNQPSVKAAVQFINGRYAADERAIMVAVPISGPPPPSPAPARSAGALPIVHIVIPSDFRDAGVGALRASPYSWVNMGGGLDGIAIDLPALNVKPTHGAYFPLNIQVRDPIWPLRTMLDISVSVKPGEPHTIWLDLRDRMLPNDRGLYLTIAGAGGDFGASALERAGLRLIFKDRKVALPEHTLDRFTQVRAVYAQLVEESPRTRRLNLFNQFETDLTDLLRVDPDHMLGRQYWYDYNKEQPRPPVTLPAPPDGVPIWAFRQVDHLDQVSRFVNWYIDNRQIENGEFGGGLSDDGDLTNWWPGTALMGATPDKILQSLRRHLDAFYAQGMFTNGLSTIQTDELHSYEEGIQVLGQAMLLDYASPTQLERAMETADATEKITGINAAGHRHIRSSYFSGTSVATEGVWGWSKPSSYLILHPAMALVEFNGSPRVKKWLLEIADGLLAHRRTGAAGVASTSTTIEFATDKDLPGAGVGAGGDRALTVLWAAYRWTGDRKYLLPFLDAGYRGLGQLSADALHQMGLRDTWGKAYPELVASGGGDSASRHFAWQVTGDTKYLEDLYADQAKAARLREFINTQGSLWIDRVNVPDAEIQRARLGGIAIVRNYVYPGHAVSWRFAEPGAEQRVAILVPLATPNYVRISAYNLDTKPVAAAMTGWNVDPGEWSMSVNGGPAQAVTFERTKSLDVTFAPRATTTIELRLVSKGVPYWSRPDLGISERDVRVSGRRIRVTVHSVGAVDAPASVVIIRDTAGRTIASASAPALKAPLDLRPKSTDVVLTVPAKANLEGASISVEMGGSVPEITLRNNVVKGVF